MMMVAWLLVIVAALFETGFAVLLKQSHGISRLWPTAGFAAWALIANQAGYVTVRWTVDTPGCCGRWAFAAC